MDASSLRVLQDLCSQKGIATSGDESFTDLMDMLRGSVATKPKAVSKAESKSAVPSTDHDEDDGGVEDKEEEEEEDAGFDAFFEAERPGLIASGFPDDDEILFEEARNRYTYIKSKVKKSPSPSKPDAAAAKQTAQTGGKEVFLPSKLPDAYAASNGMIFLRKTDGVNPFVYQVVGGKGKTAAVVKKGGDNPPHSIKASGKGAVSSAPAKKTDASMTGPSAPAKKASDVAGRKRKKEEETSLDSEDEEMNVQLSAKIQKRIMKKLSISTVKSNLKEMGWTNTKGNMAQLAQSLALNLVYDTDEEK